MLKYPIFTLFFFYLFVLFSIRISEKGGKKKRIKNNKKVSKDKKTITLKLDNGVEIPAKNIYKEISKPININDIEIDKIRVSVHEKA